MKRMSLFAAILCLALIMSLFSGCKGETPAPQAETQPAATEESSVDAAPAEESAEPEQAPVEEVAEPAAAEPEQSSLPDADGFVHYTSPAGMVYPIGDGSQTITKWTAGPTEADNIDSYNDAYILPYQLSYTGVNLEFLEVSSTAATEQFQLMIASGDWTDIMDVSSYYTGGLAQAWVDEVVIDVTDTLHTQAPDYWERVQALNDVSINALHTIADNGESLILGVKGLSDENSTNGGYVVRKDWLDQVGLTTDSMATIDGFTDALYAVQKQFGSTWTFLMEAYSSMTNCVAFDTLTPNVSSGTDMAIYLRDGQCVCSWVDDNYRNYVEWFHQLYADGIINADYYSRTWSSQTDYLQEVIQDTVFCWSSGSDTSVIKQFAPDSSIEVAPIGMIYADDSKINEWGSEASMVGMSCMSITTTCPQADLCLQYMNYNFTERGLIQANYGVEGETYVLDENGEPQFTDLIMNNPDIQNVMAASNFYTITNHLPGVTITARMNTLAGEAAMENIKVWTAPVDGTDHVLPSDFGLTTDETNQISANIADCVAFGQEMILKFITGLTPLNDETWDSYVQGFASFGLENILGVYQNAIDEYKAGNRTAVSAAAGPGGPGGPPA